MKKVDFSGLKDSVAKQRKVIREINSFYKNSGNNLKEKMFKTHIKELVNQLKKENKRTGEFLLNTNLPKKLEEKIKTPDEKKKAKITDLNFKTGFTPENKYSWKDMKPDKIEYETFKRLQKKKEKGKTKAGEFDHKVSGFVKLANRFFSKSSKKIVDDKTFNVLERDLSKANIQFTAQEYISLTLLSGIVSIFAAVIIILFFLFFNIGPELPIITRTAEQIGSRLLKTFWLIFIMPLATILIMLFYPSMEKKAKETRIDQEIPFATLNMSAIAGALIDPTDLFEIIISTKEYPKLSEQFIKLINETNVYGYDLVSALRNGAYNSPSKKLAELYSGIATTITSGGDLAEFFEKRSETLLFEYSLEKEKKTKAAETFMDIYISVVIAAPMILMILLMMMKISGLGVALSTQTITLIMVISVSVINIIFLSFLEVRK